MAAVLAADILSCVVSSKLTFSAGLFSRWEAVDDVCIKRNTVSQRCQGTLVKEK